MSPRGAASISSAATGQSKLQRDVLALGEQIVDELGLADSTDTLGRWMAHRLAELLDEAARARSAKRRESAAATATDLVLQIWRHRSAWPNGWPPKSAAAALVALDPPLYQRKKEASGSPWLDSLHELEGIQFREHQVWVRLGLADLDFDAEQRYLDEPPAPLAERERETLKRLLEMRTDGITEMLRVLDLDELPATAAARRQFAADLLGRVQVEREQLLDRVQGQVKGRRRQKKRRAVADKPR